jgi:hypothetical protein
MLEQLKFVQGSVAKKELIASLTHFRIKDGKVRGYNGTMAICSPIALDLDCCPKADAMVKAIANCDGATTVSMTPGGKLSIRSGSFRALVPTIDGDTPHVDPAGDLVQFDGEHLLKAFQTLDAFIGSDASRPWTNGILIDGQSAYATNNVCLVQYWLGAAFPHTVNIPRAAVKEVLRVGEAPTHGQIDKGSITFHYTDGRWIRTQLLETQWPMGKIAEMLDQPCNAQPINPELFKGLAKLKPMTDGAGRVYFREGALHTSTNDDEGASYELDMKTDGHYNIQMLGLLEGVVTSIDFSLYPGPCLFFGDRLRGAIIGMLQ